MSSPSTVRPALTPKHEPMHRAPVIRFGQRGTPHAMCTKCLDVIEREHQRPLARRQTRLYCIGCHGVLAWIDGGWEKTGEA